VSSIEFVARTSPIFYKLLLLNALHIQEITYETFCSISTTI